MVREGPVVYFFQECAKGLLAFPDRWISAAHNIDMFIIVPPDVRTMQIEGDAQQSAGPFRRQGPQRRHLGMDALSSIVPIVIAGASVLALVALFHAVFVHERDHKHIHSVLKPGAHRIIGKNGVQEAFQYKTGHAFAGMVPGGEQYPMSRTPIQTACAQQFHRPSACTFAEAVHLKGG